MDHLIPINRYAKKVRANCDLLVQLAHNIGIPLMSIDGTLHVDENMATALLRSKGLIAPEQVDAAPINLRSRSDAAPRIGFANRDHDGPSATVAEEDDAEFDEEDAEACEDENHEEGEGETARPRAGRRSLAKRKKVRRLYRSN
jgi:hypothetical protein